MSRSILLSYITHGYLGLDLMEDSKQSKMSEKNDQKEVSLCMRLKKLESGGLRTSIRSPGLTNPCSR